MRLRCTRCGRTGTGWFLLGVPPGVPVERFDAQAHHFALAAGDHGSRAVRELDLEDLVVLDHADRRVVGIEPAEEVPVGVLDEADTVRLVVAAHLDAAGVVEEVGELGTVDAVPNAGEQLPGARLVRASGRCGGLHALDVWGQRLFAHQSHSSTGALLFLRGSKITVTGP